MAGSHLCYFIKCIHYIQILEVQEKNSRKILLTFAKPEAQD